MKQRPKIIEMVGLGGAGKSSLRDLLSRKNDKFQELQIPNKIRYVPFFARSAFLWMPIYLQRYRQDRCLTLEEIRAMGRLDQWLAYIRSLPQPKYQAVMIDPGSVYWLSMLQEFGPALTKDPRFMHWWQNKLDQWSSAIDVIIWLDAPDELLLKRIQEREEWHEAKEQKPEVALAYFARYRAWYERVVAEMTARRPIKVFRFRTDQISTEEMANQILQEINATG